MARAERGDLGAGMALEPGKVHRLRKPTDAHHSDAKTLSHSISSASPRTRQENHVAVTVVAACPVQSDQEYRVQADRHAPTLAPTCQVQQLLALRPFTRWRRRGVP